MDSKMQQQSCAGVLYIHELPPALSKTFATVQLRDSYSIECLQVCVFVISGLFVNTCDSA